MIDIYGLNGVLGYIYILLQVRPYISILGNPIRNTMTTYLGPSIDLEFGVRYFPSQD